MEVLDSAASFHGGNLATDAPQSPHLLAPSMKGFVYVAGADSDLRHGNRNEDYGFGKGGDIPLDRIGIQLFTVRDLFADNELDMPGTFEVLRDASYAELEFGHARTPGHDFPQGSATQMW